MPFRFLKLICLFIKSPHTFKTTLLFLCVDKYRAYCLSKIEVLNKKIYLNCKSNLLPLIKLFNPKKIGEVKTFEGILELKKISENFRYYEKKNQEYVAMPLAVGLKNNGKVLFTPHYVHVSGKNVLHATSNIPKKLDACQAWYNALPSAVKGTAVKPATIVSFDIKTVQAGTKFIIIPKYEINAIKFKFIEQFDLADNAEDLLYQEQKQKIYKNFISTYGSLTNHLVNVDDLTDRLVINEFQFRLHNTTTADILQQIEAEISSSPDE